MTFLNSMLENFEAAYADAVRADAWHSVRIVKLGAWRGGELVVRVPTANQTYKAEVYWRSLDDTQDGIAVNTVAPEDANLMVRIGKIGDDKRWLVRDIYVPPEVSAVTNQYGVAPHGEQHSARNLGVDGVSAVGRVGSDLVINEARQVWNANISPGTSMVAYATPGWIHFGSALAWFDGADLNDLTAWIPAASGLARYVLVELDRDHAIIYSFGSTFSNEFPPNVRSSYVPPPDANRYQLGAICLVYGMEAIDYQHIWAGHSQLALVDAARVMQILEYRIDRLEELVYKLANATLP